MTFCFRISRLTLLFLNELHSKSNRMASSIPTQDDQTRMWEQEQRELRGEIVTRDTEVWQKAKLVAGSTEKEDDICELRYVAGMDISSLKSDNNIAYAALVVCELPSLKIVYNDCEFVELNQPYIAGYLSFREAPPLLECYNRLKSSNTKFIPQALLIDGNGMLHARECGLACHVGVQLDIPTVGVAKNLFHVDGLEKNEQHKEKIHSLTNKGDSFPLIGASGRTLGVALKTAENANNPVYVSIGHKISLETASWLVTLCSKYRVPEPIRQADRISREFIRKNFPDEDS